MGPLLLDTCAAIWLVQDELTGESLTTLQAAAQAGMPTYVSPITAWEIGLLVSLKRLNLQMSPESWFRRILDQPSVRLADMPPALLIAASFLPGKPPNDPADRIIIATGRDLGAAVVTRDRALLRYGEQGYVSTLAC